MAASQCWADEQGKELVDRFGSIWEDEVEKIYALETLKLSPSQDKILDAGLQCIQNVESSQLAKRRWFMRFPSYRATMGCYGRILAELESGRLEIGGDDQPFSSTQDEEEETKRQNLLQLLEILSTHPKGVWSLEGEMIKSAGIQDFGAKYGGN